jgi:hypothetical protein
MTYVIGRAVVLAAALFATLFASGCRHAAKGAPDSMLDKAFDATTVTQAGVDLRNATSSAERDRIIDNRLMMINHQYRLFREALQHEQSQRNVGNGIANLFIGMAGATSGSKSSKAALATITTLLDGSNTIIDESLLHKKAVAALLAGMDGKRAEVRLRIGLSLGKSLEQYPPSEAAADLDAYETAGSLLAGLEHIEAVALKQKEATEIEIDALVRDIYRLNPSQRDIKRCSTLSLAAANGNRTLANMTAAATALGVTATPAQLASAPDLARVLQDHIRQAATADAYTKLDAAFRAANLYSTCGG